jgi:Helix-turn-helix domain
MGASQGASPNPSLSTGASAGEPSLSRRASSGPGGHIVVEICPDLSLWSTSVGRDDSGVLTATKDKDAPGDVRRIIRDTRRAAGLSQQRLATLANCSVASVALLESGFNPGRSQVLRAFCARWRSAHPTMSEASGSTPRLRGRAAMMPLGHVQGSPRDPRSAPLCVTLPEVLIDLVAVRVVEMLGRSRPHRPPG